MIVITTSGFQRFPEQNLHFAADSGARAAEHAGSELPLLSLLLSLLVWSYITTLTIVINITSTAMTETSSFGGFGIAYRAASSRRATERFVESRHPEFAGLIDTLGACSPPCFYLDCHS